MLKENFLKLFKVIEHHIDSKNVEFVFIYVDVVFELLSKLRNIDSSALKNLIGDNQTQDELVKRINEGIALVHTYSEAERVKHRIYTIGKFIQSVCGKSQHLHKLSETVESVKKKACLGEKKIIKPNVEQPSNHSIYAGKLSLNQSFADSVKSLSKNSEPIDKLVQALKNKDKITEEILISIRSRKSSVLCQIILPYTRTLVIDEESGLEPIHALEPLVNDMLSIYHYHKKKSRDVHVTKDILDFILEYCVLIKHAVNTEIQAHQKVCEPTSVQHECPTQEQMAPLIKQHPSKLPERFLSINKIANEIRKLFIIGLEVQSLSVDIKEKALSAIEQFIETIISFGQVTPKEEVEYKYSILNAPENLCKVQKHREMFLTDKLSYPNNQIMASDLIIEMLSSNFDKVQKLLGEPPCGIALLLLGSTAAKHRFPYSDLEFACLHSGTSKLSKIMKEKVEHYCLALLHAFQAFILELGEDNEESDGLRIDSSTHLLSSVTLIGAHEELIKNHFKNNLEENKKKKLCEIKPFTETAFALRCSLLINKKFGAEELYNQFQTALEQEISKEQIEQKIVKELIAKNNKINLNEVLSKAKLILFPFNINKTIILSWWLHILSASLERLDKINWFGASKQDNIRFNLKSEFYMPIIYTILNFASLEGQCISGHPYEIVGSLNAHKSMKNLVKKLLFFVSKNRIKLHLEKKRQHEDFVLSKNSEEERIYFYIIHKGFIAPTFQWLLDNWQMMDCRHYSNYLLTAYDKFKIDNALILSGKKCKDLLAISRSSLYEPVTPFECMQLSNLVYKSYNREKRLTEEKVLDDMVTVDHCESGLDGFGASAFFNITKRALVIAFRGTKWKQEPGNYNADLEILLGKGDFNSLKEAIRFVSRVLESFKPYIQFSSKEKLQPFQLYFTGHSLGGHIAGYCNYYFADYTPLSYVFDSPCFIAHLENIMKVIPSSKLNQLDIRKFPVINYIRYKNLINSLGGTFSSYIIVGAITNRGEKIKISNLFALNPLNCHPMENILDLLDKYSDNPETVIYLNANQYNSIKLLPFNQYFEEADTPVTADANIDLENEYITANVTKTTIFVSMILPPVRHKINQMIREKGIYDQNKPIYYMDEKNRKIKFTLGYNQNRRSLANEQTQDFLALTDAVEFIGSWSFNTFMEELLASEHDFASMRVPELITNNLNLNQRTRNCLRGEGDKNLCINELYKILEYDWPPFINGLDIIFFIMKYIKEGLKVETQLLEDIDCDNTRKTLSNGLLLVFQLDKCVFLLERAIFILIRKIDASMTILLNLSHDKIYATIKQLDLLANTISKNANFVQKYVLLQKTHYLRKLIYVIHDLFSKNEFACHIKPVQDMMKLVESLLYLSAIKQSEKVRRCTNDAIFMVPPETTENSVFKKRDALKENGEILDDFLQSCFHMEGNYFLVLASKITLDFINLLNKDIDMQIKLFKSPFISEFIIAVLTLSKYDCILYREAACSVIDFLINFQQCILNSPLKGTNADTLIRKKMNSLHILNNKPKQLNYFLQYLSVVTSNRIKQDPFLQHLITNELFSIFHLWAFSGESSKVCLETNLNFNTAAKRDALCPKNIGMLSKNIKYYALIRDKSLSPFLFWVLRNFLNMEKKLIQHKDFLIKIVKKFPYYRTDYQSNNILHTFASLPFLYKNSQETLCEILDNFSFKNYGLKNNLEKTALDIALFCKNRLVLSYLLRQQETPTKDSIKTLSLEQTCLSLQQLLACYFFEESEFTIHRTSLKLFLPSKLQLAVSRFLSSSFFNSTLFYGMYKQISAIPCLSAIENKPRFEGPEVDRVFLLLYNLFLTEKAYNRSSCINSVVPDTPILQTVEMYSELIFSMPLLGAGRGYKPDIGVVISVFVVFLIMKGALSSIPREQTFFDYFSCQNPTAMVHLLYFIQKIIFLIMKNKLELDIKIIYSPSAQASHMAVDRNISSTLATFFQEQEKRLVMEINQSFSKAYPSEVNKKMIVNDFFENIKCLRTLHNNIKAGLTSLHQSIPAAPPENHQEGAISGPMKKIVDNDSSADIAWYTDDEMNQLLRHYLKDNEQVTFLDGMLGTDWPDNVLKVNLQQFHTQRLNAIAQGKRGKDRVLIPVNLNNNHWVLVYFVFQQDAAESPDVYYFDPLGGEVNTGVEKAIKSQTLYPDLSLVNLSDRVQDDGYNCGPWVIEAARSIADVGKIPDKKLNINLARKIQREVLHGGSNPLKSSQSPISECTEIKTMFLYVKYLSDVKLPNPPQAEQVKNSGQSNNDVQPK